MVLPFAARMYAALRNDVVDDSNGETTIELSELPKTRDTGSLAIDVPSGEGGGLVQEADVAMAGAQTEEQSEGAEEGIASGGQVAVQEAERAAKMAQAKQSLKGTALFGALHCMRGGRRLLLCPSSQVFR